MIARFTRSLRTALGIAFLLSFSAGAAAQPAAPTTIGTPVVDKWVTATGSAAGTNIAAQDEAIAKALRNAIEQACGTFLAAQSKTQDYKSVYDRILANAVGYIIEHKPPKIRIRGGITHAEVTACVSKEKFKKDWAHIAHTVAQENNPRVIIAVTDATWTEPFPIRDALMEGVVQSKLEDFFLSKGLLVVDRATTIKVNKRDIILAGLKGDIRELAALGARFKADVVIYGQVSSRYGGVIRIADCDAHKFVATLNVRAVRTDSGQLMVSKAFGPVTVTSLQHGGGREKATAKLADDSAPKLLNAVVEAWRRQVHVTRNIQLSISGMDYDGWKRFRDEVKKIRGIKGLHLREITEGVTVIDLEYEFKTQVLADRLSELKATNLKVVEFNPNRLKLKLVK